jgi:hypothetical protein
MRKLSFWFGILSIVLSLGLSTVVSGAQLRPRKNQPAKTAV